VPEQANGKKICIKLGNEEKKRIGARGRRSYGGKKMSLAYSKGKRREGK
jgi:hypothetical protein